MTDLSECKVLVVDDTEANIDLLVEALGDDYELMVAMDGEDAVELVLEEPPDLILLDIMMPGMDGFEVCEKLKTIPSAAQIPFVFLSGKTDKEDIDKGLAAGALDYIIKPFDLLDVQNRVKKYLENILQQ